METILQSFHRNILVPIGDFIYPPTCFICDKYLEERDCRVCPACWGSFVELTLAGPTWIEIKQKFETEGFIKDFLSCYLFEKEGALQEVIHLLKYRGIKSLGVKLGREIGRRMTQNAAFTHADYLLPVPLHRLKQRERGYNQSEYICNGISAMTQIPVHTSLLIRKKYTVSQTLLTLDERRENVGDAFVVSPRYRSLVQWKTFILVDDVITTGSTINACAKELMSNGASMVLAASTALAM